MATKIIMEAGINHQGDIDTAIKLIHLAHETGCDYIKWQKRTPELCVPGDEWDKPKQTPWGTVEPYISYRRKMEFGLSEFKRIDVECRKLGIGWFSSVWDMPSLDFILTNFPNTPYIKIPSALMEDQILQKTALDAGYPVVISTGMHTQDEINQQMLWLVNTFGASDKITIMACHAAYPSPESEINIDAMVAYQGLRQWPYKIGFSSHAASPFVPILAIAYAQPTMVEVHATLSRTLPGSDHAASLERKGLELLVRERDRFYTILGDGKLRLYDSELSARKKLKGK